MILKCEQSQSHIRKDEILRKKVQQSKNLKEAKRTKLVDNNQFQGNINREKWHYFRYIIERSRSYNYSDKLKINKL